jgi:hypothetical protein
MIERHDMSPSFSRRLAILPYRFGETSLELLIGATDGEVSLIDGFIKTRGSLTRDATVLSRRSTGIRGKLHKRYLRPPPGSEFEDMYIFLLDANGSGAKPVGYTWLHFQAAADLFGEEYSPMFGDLVRRLRGVKLHDS